jgi:hypothetical protein
MRFATPHNIPSGENQAGAIRLIFRELTQVCLWGNSTDLSLLINVRPIVP